jgi:hypothetical protein
MKKPLDAATIVNELRGQSAFFPTKAPLPVPEQSGEPTEKKAFARLPAHQQTEKEAEQHVSNSANIQTSNHTSLQDSIDASKHASTLAIKPDIIEIIRKIVKTPAKEEVLYVRLTKEEKQQLGDIEYTYDRQDIDTSANELGRIAVNFLIEDYKANGENSILAKVLTALHA